MPTLARAPSGSLEAEPPRNVATSPVDSVSSGAKEGTDTPKRPESVTFAVSLKSATGLSETARTRKAPLPSSAAGTSRRRVPPAGTASVSRATMLPPARYSSETDAPRFALPSPTVRVVV